MNESSPANSKYAIIWFEGDSPYTMVDKKGKTVILGKEAALQQASGLLHTQDDVDAAEDDLKYAITTTLLEDLFGWDVNQ